MQDFYTYLETFRYERKYLTYLDHKTIDILLKTHPAFFKEIYKQRFINNIYFDTSRLDFFYDTIEGKASRYKFRIRWYGELFGQIDNPLLEVKIKKGYVITKETYLLEPFEFNKNFNFYQLKQLLEKSNIPDKIKTIIKNLQPTLLNRYQRKYFIDNSNKFRITYDFNIFYYNPLLPNFFDFKLADNDNLLELKYSNEFDLEAKNISDYLPFRLTKNSKYGKGISNFYKVVD